MGRKQSIETREKIRQKLTGKKQSAETIEKRVSHFRGANHPRWKGGVSFRYKIKSAPRKKPMQCEICGAMGKICYDHDHKTDKFRGWICSRCNLVLGMVNDNKELLSQIIEYLKWSI